DGSVTTPVDIVNRVNGSFNNPTTAAFMNDAHVYADNGNYTVTVRVADDNMGAFSDPTLFQSGVKGVDYVDLQFTIAVQNVAPTIAPIAVPLTVNEGQAFAISSEVSAPYRVLLQDRGFDNALNPLSQPGGSSEIFFGGAIDWGDGTPAGTLSINNLL